MKVERISAFLPTSAPAYSAGDVVGGLIEFTPGSGPGMGVLKNLYVVDAANQGAELFLTFFRELPEGTYTDNAALNIDAADIEKLVCSVEVLAATYKTQDGIALANTAYSVGLQWEVPKAGGVPKLYAVATTTGTPTYGPGTDILRIDGYLLRDSNR